MDLIVQLFNVALVDPITNMLVAMSRLFGGNFGVAIIVFTILMRIVTWPLTASQYKASKAMQAIQPKVQELQKKYKGKDPKKMQAEMMGLYREAGVNPLGCLLPMLVQMPIWIALYQVIRITLGETPESFVSLSQRLYAIEYVRTAVPLDNHLLFWNLGQRDTTFILPLIVAVTMYIQQKMITPKPLQGALTQQQQQTQQTQQMMTWMLPLMFGYFSTTVPAGLALYWGMSNIAGVTLQYFYVGRKVDWRNMVPMIGSRPEAAPAARPKAQPVVEDEAEDEEDSNGTEKRKRTGKRDTKAPAPETDAESESDVEEAEPVEAKATRVRQARRKRHGRRRGKR